MTPFDKIKVLLQSDDIMNVNMGIELLNAIVTEPEQILQALGIETEISSMDELEGVLMEFEHKGTILVWTLGKWAELGVDWVLKLERLNLRDNQLTSIPEQLGLLTKLTYLNLNYNQLTSIPEQIQTLTNLTELELGENNISDEEQSKLQSLLPNCWIIF